jgi:hypothetical protein
MASSCAQTSSVESFSADVLLVDSEVTTAKIAPTLRISYRVVVSRLGRVGSPLRWRAAETVRSQSACCANWAVDARTNPTLRQT